jgi:hypothetical protein
VNKRGLFETFLAMYANWANLDSLLGFLGLYLVTSADYHKVIKEAVKSIARSNRVFLTVFLSAKKVAKKWLLSNLIWLISLARTWQHCSEEQRFHYQSPAKKVQ